MRQVEARISLWLHYEESASCWFHFLLTTHLRDARLAGNGAILFGWLGHFEAAQIFPLLFEWCQLAATTAMPQLKTSTKCDKSLGAKRLIALIGGRARERALLFWGPSVW